MWFQVHKLTCLRWLLVLVNKLSMVVVLLTVSRIVHFLTLLNIVSSTTNIIAIVISSITIIVNGDDKTTFILLWILNIYTHAVITVIGLNSENPTC